MKHLFDRLLNTPLGNAENLLLIEFVFGYPIEIHCGCHFNIY